MKYLNIHFRNIIFILTLLLVNNAAKAQRSSDMEYSIIDSSVVGKDVPEYTNKQSSFYWSTFDYAVYEFTNILKASNRNKKEQQRLENARQQTTAKLSIIKTQYAEYKDYPEKITDGWHSAIATDNINFCKDVKVYVKNNRVIRFVIDNYIPLDFKATRDIKNAKNVISINNFGGEQMNLVELYFLYDIDAPVIVPEPIKAGCVCFWSDIKNFADIQLTFDGVRLEDFTVRFGEDETPDCFRNGMICRILKPGTYSFKADGKGAINWGKTIEIKENQCLKIRLGRVRLR